MKDTLILNETKPKSIIIDGNIHYRFKILCKGKSMKIGGVIEDLIQLYLSNPRELQKMIDENVAVFAKDLDKAARLFFVKFLISGLAIIILGNALWYLIKRKIEDIKKRPKHLDKDDYTKIVAGLISDEFKTRELEQQKNYEKTEKPLHSEQKNRLPTTPSAREIEEMLDRKNIQKLSQNPKYKS